MKPNRDYQPIDSLRNWDKNPRGIKQDRFNELKQRITRFGQFKPVVATPDGEVLGGNMRLRAYRELGINDIWVSIVEPKTEAEKIEIALADNDEMGYYEDQALAELIAQFKDEIDLTKYAVHLGQPQTLADILAQFSPEEVVEDEVPDVPEIAESQLGEIYQLGRHRLMCGDSTKIEDATQLMDGQKADMVFTDPPYNIAYEGGSKKREMIENDQVEDFYQFLLDAYTSMFTFTKGGAAFYVCHADSERVNFTKAFKDAGGYLSSVIIWAKNNATFGRSDYFWRHEPILYGWNAAGSHQWFGDRKQDTIWNIDRPSRSDEHPTMKPIELIARAIRNSSKTDDLVTDLFLGSGSTLIACEQTGRTCYGMELDPKYCDVIRKRYWKFINADNEEGWIEGTKETGK